MASNVLQAILPRQLLFVKLANRTVDSFDFANLILPPWYLSRQDHTLIRPSRSMMKMLYNTS